ncbi:MAG TPA: ABC transporter permease [Phototrophicaceae bacterium]|jgi:spermidine/putrescine transport system permease protein|nr:ABC transporter permease [Phototrophicaceae bacterium]
MGNQVISRPTINTSLPVAGDNLRSGMLIRNTGKVTLFLTPIFSYFFLWAPILLLVIFSFNDSRGVDAWRGFTFKWYQNIFNGAVGTEGRFSTELMLNSLSNSLIIAAAATVISTLIGTMVAISLVRTNFPGKKLIDGLLFLPVVIPEITQGVSLAIFFKIVFDFIEQTSGNKVLPGFGTIIVGHVAFNISYVAIVVRARMANMNPKLEEAAQDLGANQWQTFYRITLPLIMPGIIAGALLALTMSLDDFVVTFFNAGVGTTTLPMFVYGLLKVSVTPEVNALSAIMLVVSMIMVGFSLMLQNRSSSL